MAFWSDASLGTPEPKRSYRWLLYLGDVPQWVVKKVTKPSFSITETSHTYINHNFYYPGKVEWSEVNVTLVDPASPDAVQTMYNALRASGYSPPENQFDTQTISKQRAVNALGQVRIVQLGDQFADESDNGAMSAGQEFVEEWILYNAWIKDAKFGDLDYTSDELVEIELTLRYDYAKLNGDNNQSQVPNRDAFGG
jgi:hypothetical protein|tara:strand:- start:15 stop:602 length:588 start_codon:yes stop_codon:yes gene_type:complete